MKFTALDLNPAIQQALDDSGYTDMTPIQKQAIVPARRGKDLLANAQTGTGKTAAFALPILQKLSDSPRALAETEVRALILTPTRELAQQLAETIGRYNQHLGLRILSVYGGTTLETQKKKLRQGADILIATPGRLLEHIVACNVSLGHTEFVVLDEADRMLDMGFLSDVSKVLDSTPKSRQTMLFSATLSEAVHKLSNKILTRPEKSKLPGRTQSPTPLSTWSIRLRSNVKPICLPNCSKRKTGFRCWCLPAPRLRPMS